MPNGSPRRAARSPASTLVRPFARVGGTPTRVTVIGSGSWGTTLAALVADVGGACVLWVHDAVEADAMARRRENTRFLPGIPLPDTLTITHDAAAALDGAEVVVLAVPMQRLAENVEHLERWLPPAAILVSGIKGLDPPSGARVSEAMAELVGGDLSERFAVVSGPNFAREIAAREPAATVVASAQPDVARTVQRALRAPWFRAYTSDDVIGVELAGSLKNVIAIGAGMADGLRASQNSKAVLITRGLAEMTRLGVAAGANPLTFSGLAGVGDLIATCSSARSRNHYVGSQLAQGRPLDEITAQMVMVAEGVEASRGALRLAQRLKVEMPIVELMNVVLFEGLPVSEAGERLMAREPSHELWGIGGQDSSAGKPAAGFTPSRE